MPDTRTLTDIYDGLRRIRRPKPAGVAALVLTAALVVTGCAGKPIDNPICGTTQYPPVRVHDAECAKPGTAVRWYEAPPGDLDEEEDRTEIGEVIDSDYLPELEDADEDEASGPALVPVPVITSTPKPTAKPKPTPKPKARTSTS